MPHARQIVAALRSSHQRLVDVTAGLGPTGARSPSFDDEWSIAQVLSHLGSGAEIFTMIVGAVVAGEPAPGRDAFPAVWDVWNARGPDQQVANGLEVDRAFVELLESLSDVQLALPVDLFGMDLDVGEVGRLRLNEHALHTWDVAVMAEPSATVRSDAVELLVDRLGPAAGRSGKPASMPRRIGITTVGPARTFELVTGDPVTLVAAGEVSAGGPEPAPGGEPGEGPWLELPAEALLRLVAGRLDAAHTPDTVLARGIELDDLRASFPGY